MFKGMILLMAAAACFAQDQQQQVRDTAQQMMQTVQEITELRKEMKEIKDARQAAAVKAPPKFYKLEFVLKEVDGDRVLNSRAYSMTMSTESTPASIRAIAKMPIGEAGVRIDVRNLRELQNQVSLALNANVSGVVDASDPSHAFLREFQWGSDVLVPARKPTVVYRSESTTSTSQMEVEVTATPLM